MCTEEPPSAFRVYPRAMRRRLPRYVDMRLRGRRPARLLSIESVHVKNFRAIEDDSLALGRMTALIGANGSGKTTALLALERFFADRTRLMEADDFNGKRKRTLRITVKFRDTETGRGFRVARTWRRRGKAVEAPRYSWGKRTNADCKRYLSENVSVIYVPAEHETDSDGEDKKNSVWESIVNAAIRSRVTLDRERKAMHKRIQEQHGERLKQMEELINGKLTGRGGEGYAPNARAIMSFSEPEVKAAVDLKVRDLASLKSVGHKYVGHGTKRAFYMAALEVLAELPEPTGPPDEGAGKAPARLSLVVIDEPELHQHPQRQAVILGALRNLSRNGTRQVVYSTHSPHFVALKAPMSVRKVKQASGRVKIHEAASLDEARVRGASIRSLEEAAFANGVVLVEGYTDRVILGSVLRNAVHKRKKVMEALIKNEVAIAECGTKGSVIMFCDVLDSLGIEKYVIWDGDMGHAGEQARDAWTKNEKIAKRLGQEPGFLQRLAGAGRSDCVAGAGCACFGVNANMYFEGCFKTRGKGLKRSVLDGEGIDGRLDHGALERTGFFRKVVPAIYDRLAKEGGG